ncbi:Peptidase aspartic, catalytic [Cucumis melo var. makuwa]|uniref:Peptidase aspartic, catalytic n=1 Tax=Cucumis melo var. makuwa TaxID=1194695 RepID=A0A5A7UKD6_CUCMM|nr:Peptidase aspartic, catalytic [Cucumis melo var. makuwa]TYK10912.1 Peptidase aspartic, catalytic [Cucumis melo var. makuwa]
MDDFSRFTWVRFLKGTSDTAKVCISLCLSLQREQGKNIVRIRSDHGKKFVNEELNNFYEEEGIHHEYSTPLTPQQNGVVERKNRTLREMARVMIHAKSLSLHFWAEAVNTACHIHNRITTRSGTTITLYKLWKGRKPNAKHFHVFGSTCYTLVDKEYHKKWDVKSEKRIFLDVAAKDYEQTYKRIDDDDELAPKVTMVPEIAAADVPIADTCVNNFEDDSKLT